MRDEYSPPNTVETSLMKNDFGNGGYDNPIDSIHLYFTGIHKNRQIPHPWVLRASFILYSHMLLDILFSISSSPERLMCRPEGLKSPMPHGVPTK
jgi:hypothetical protein